MATNISKTYTAVVWSHPTIARSIAMRLANAPEEWIWQYIDRPVKIDYDAMIVIADLRLTEGTQQVALKQYRSKSIAKALLAPLRPCRAMKCWQKAHWLLAHDIPTPTPLLAIRPKSFNAWGTSYLATKWIAGAENLHLYLRRIAGNAGARRRRAAHCAKRLGQIMGRMHNAGLRHRDLKAANLLVVNSGPVIAAYLVDLDGLRSSRVVGLEERAADLARLAVSMTAHPWIGRSIYARFLRAYADQSPAVPIDRKALWRAVQLRAAAIVARKKHCGQQIL